MAKTSDYWTKWEILITNGNPSSSSRDIAIEDAVRSIEEGMQSDPAYQADAKINGVVSPMLVTRKSALRSDIRALPSTSLHIGDVVDCFNEKWIVIETYADKIGFVCGYMWLCNASINFQNGTTTIYNRPCVIDDGSYPRSTGSQVIHYMENSYGVYMSLDEQTQKLYVDKRLGFGTIFSNTGEEVLEVYKINGIDLKSKNHGDGSHLMLLYMVRDVYDPANDSIAQNLCDVFVDDPDIPEPTPEGRCEVIGSDEIRSGTHRTYRCAFFDSQGQEVTVDNPTVIIEKPSDVTYTTADDVITITVPFASPSIGETVTITLSEPSGNYGQYVKKVQVIQLG